MTVNSLPKVSVLMSAYNKGQFLQETLPTVLSQTFSDFEFIIFDNCSSDNSAEIIGRFDDKRIRFFQNSRNLGPVASMNNCIEASTGEYLVFFHGDDLWEPTFLETNILLLDRMESVNVCHSLMHSIDEAGVKSVSPPAKEVGSYEITPYAEVLKRLFKGCYIKTPTVVYRRSIMRFYDFRYNYVVDWDMYLHLAAAENDFLFINEPLMYYRTSSGSETSLGVKGGALIIESYLVLRNFFSQYAGYSQFSRKTFKRLSDATMRRARDAENREKASFLMRCSFLFYPLQLLNPVFHLYFLVSLFFGPTGLQMLKSSKIKNLWRNNNATVRQ